MLQAAQIRAARALLGWRQDDLARASGVGPATIRRIEILRGPIKGNISTQMKIEQALERAGIHFIDADASGGIGVRLVSGPSKGRVRRRV
jgi:transcriptional regulator with XRE-family HTH domain